MKGSWGKSILVVTLVAGLTFGTAVPSAVVAQAAHGTVSETIGKDQLKDTPPGPEEYDVNMSM